jgi:hypothetical protein
MNRPIHFEIMADDPQRAAEFYRRVFSWVFEKWDKTPVEYWLITTGPDTEPGINGGMSRRQSPGPCECHSAYLCTIGVRSVDETTEKIIAAGGSVTRPKMEVMGVGMLAMCRDTEGNNFGVLEASPPQEPAKCSC